MQTGALVCAITVLTCAAVQTGFGVALVDVMLAVAASEARRTQTGEGVDAVYASSSIKTGAEKEKEPELVEK